MFNNEERDNAKSRSYLEGLNLRLDSPTVRETRDRLRTGGDYQLGDVVPIFDSTGAGRFVRIDACASNAYQVTLGGLHFAWPNFNTETQSVEYTPKQLDQFTRGLRSDITTLTFQTHFEVSQLTTMTADFVRLVQEARSTGDYSKVPQLPDEMIRRHLKEGARGIFFTEPANYQVMIDAALEFTAWNKQRAEQRAGIQLAGLRTPVDLEQALRQVLGEEAIPVTGESTISGPVLHKYASRMSVGLRLAMATIECWYREQGHHQLQRTTISE